MSPDAVFKRAVRCLRHWPVSLAGVIVMLSSPAFSQSVEEELAALKLRVQTLEDKEQISHLLYQYGTGLDTLNWEILESIFADDATMVMAGPTGDLENALILEKDQFVATGRHFMTRLYGTQHVSTHHEIEVTGDTARSTSYMTAFHLLPDEDANVVAVGAGLYTHEFRKTSVGWKITRITDGILWNDPALPQGEVLFGLPRVRGVTEDSLPAGFMTGEDAPK